MPDSLYDTDVLAWSQAQAARLRRVAAGERLNDLDWAHVIGEIEAVVRGELRSVRAFLELALLHALKVLAWPGHPATQHWRIEVENFLVQARHRFEPGMALQIDLPAIYARALRALRGAEMPGGSAALTEVTVPTLSEVMDATCTVDTLLASLRLPPPPAAPAHRRPRKPAAKASPE